MTSQYRQKLLNWLTSVAVVLLATVLAANFSWFSKVPKAVEAGVLDPWHITASLANSAVFLVLFLVAALIWHTFDLIERAPPQHRTAKSLVRYHAFLSILLVLGAFTIATEAGVGSYNSCDELKGALHFECFVGIHDWIMIPNMIASGVALLLCIVKAVWSVWSLIKKPE